MGSCDSGDSSLLTLEKQLEMFRRVNDYLLFHAHGEEAETEVERRLNVLVTSEGGGHLVCIRDQEVPTTFS